MGISDVLKPKSKEEIDSVVNRYMTEFEEIHLPNDFKWRKGQKEAIEQVIQTYLENKYKTVILDAPVGSGKSLIAMGVSFILNEIGKKGFVLASEISLQDQYEKDIRDYRLTWGSVKGVDNYMCIDNDEKHSLGTCRVRNRRPAGMSCYGDCPYFSARNYAMEAETAVLNYNYWMIMMNAKESLFPERDFTVCDEAHKVLDIVQSHYSPRFDKDAEERLVRLSDFFANHRVAFLSKEVGIISTSIKNLWITENQDQIHEILMTIELSLEKFLNAIELLKKRVMEEYPNTRPPRDWRRALFTSDWVKDIHCKVEDYNLIILNTSTRNIVKNPSGEELVFNCLEEKYMMNRYFHRFTGFTVLMSATFSDPREYMRNMNIPGAKHIKMDNLFPFEKSPIYYYPKRRMSYKHIEENSPWLFEKINEIIEKHDGESGLIHSASYDLTNKIKDNLTATNRRRVFVYNGTDEKRKTLDMMKMTKGNIIMGPSILEGLDMKDDFSRFQIFAKVPYLSLSDRFVKTKLQYNPGWYRWKAIINILQGTGRSVRNEDDWAITYILDGALGDLIHNNRASFPPEFMQRIQVVNE